MTDPLPPLPPLLVLDGGLATELERHGADLGGGLWSARLLLDEPARIRRVHDDYLDAGADVITTASYQASFEGLARRGLDADAAAALMQRSVALAREARDAWWADPAHRAGRRRPLVAASVGPYGAALADGSEYRGHYGVGPATLRAFHERRLHELWAAGPDLLAIETIPSLPEAIVLADLVAALPGARAWIAFQCRDGAHTAEGQDIADCARALDGREAIVALGVNCTAPAHVGDLVDRLAGASRLPIVVYPNSGETYDADHQCWQPGRNAPTPFADAACGWVRRGARLIGGCCRTGPADIAAIRAALDEGAGS